MSTDNFKQAPQGSQEPENIPSLQSPGSTQSPHPNFNQQNIEQDNQFLLEQFDPHQEPHKQSHPHPTQDLKENTSHKEKSLVLPDKIELEDCLLHKKPLDILCLIQKVMICSSCALFGDHKGHQFRNSDQIDQDVIKREEQILEIIERKSKSDKQKFNQINLEAIEKLLKEKKDEIVSKLSGEVQKLIKQIRICEKGCLTKIDQEFTKSLQKYQTNSVKLSSTQKQYDIWQLGALTHVQELLTCKTLEQKVKGLKEYSSEAQLVKEGRSIIANLENTYKELEKQKSRCINNVQIIIDTSFLNKLKRFAKVQTVLDRELNLVSMESKNNISLSSIQNMLDEPLTIQVTGPNNLRVETSMLSLETSMRSNKKSPLYKSQFLLSPRREKILKDDMNSRTKTRMRSPTKPETPLEIARYRRIRLKLSEKYDKIMEEVIADTTEIFDLTNAELGNDSTIQMLQLLKGNNKVRTVKLGKNRLSDDIIPNLWKNLGKVQTLNLSNNFFTQKIIDSFMSNLPDVPHLKSLVLTQNKLIARSLKAKIEQLKQIGILITL